MLPDNLQPFPGNNDTTLNAARKFTRARRS
jgi:hypothetical protein